MKNNEIAEGVGAITAHVYELDSIISRKNSGKQIANQTPCGENRENPASAGYHEIRPKPILGQYTPYRIHFTRQTQDCQATLHKNTNFTARQDFLWRKAIILL